MRRTGFETSWWLGVGDAKARGYFFHQPFRATASRTESGSDLGSDLGRGDPVHQVLADRNPGASKWLRKRSDKASRCRFESCLLDRSCASRSSPTGRGPRFRTASVRVRPPRAVRRNTIRVRSTAGCGALNPEIEVRILGPEQSWRVGVSGEHAWPSTRRRAVRARYALPPAQPGRLAELARLPFRKRATGRDPQGFESSTFRALHDEPREHDRPCTGLLIRETGFDSLTRYARQDPIRRRPTEGRLTVTQVIGVRIPASEQQDEVPGS